MSWTRNLSRDCRLSTKEKLLSVRPCPIDSSRMQSLLPKPGSLASALLHPRSTSWLSLATKLLCPERHVNLTRPSLEGYIARGIRADGYKRRAPCRGNDGILRKWDEPVRCCRRGGMGGKVGNYCKGQGWCTMSAWEQDSHSSCHLPL